MRSAHSTPQPVRRGYERKFVAAADFGDALIDALDRLLARDSQADADGGYAVHSLYFDTPDRAVYRRAEGRGQAKLRLRRYGDDPTVYLERKGKDAQGRVDKIRTPVPADRIGRLALPHDDDWEGAWFARLLADGRFSPAQRVSYRRIAWDGFLDERPVRVTLDRDIRAEPAATVGAPVPVHAGTLLAQVPVVEMKHEGAFPERLARLAEDAGLLEASFSKYRRAVDAGA